MDSWTMRLFAIILSIKVATGSDTIYKFPDGFLIGTGSSAYQVEGSLNVSGRSMGFFDYAFHKNPKIVIDRSNANVATDFYHKYPEDIKYLQEIGFQHHRISLNWPRILPTGYANKINIAAVRHYHKVLDEFEKRGIEPIVTLYHWDHPQSLEDEFGGWLDEKMIYLFADYARVIFREFGSRIKYYVTLNEMTTDCFEMKMINILIGNQVPGNYEYICVHNQLKAHALVYHIYDKEFRRKHNGLLSISIPVIYSYSSNETDQETANISFEFNAGWVANPIFSKEGDYPEIMKKLIAERSKSQGLSTSKLPKFSKEWIDLLRGSWDYFGLNHYNSDIVSPLPLSEISDWPNDAGLVHSFDPNWGHTQSPVMRIYPKGFRDLLRRIKRQYGNPPVFVLENGIAIGNGTDDKTRSNYLYSYMKEMLIAMYVDGCDVRGYTIWSLTDSFEWLSGYTLTYGMIDVDFDDKNRKRTLKNSVSWIKPVLASRVLTPPIN